MKKYLVLLIVSIAASSLAVGAQGLKDNPDYQKSLELKAMASQAFDDGDYDAAAEYAGQAKDYASLSDKYVEKMLLKSGADKAIAIAKAKMAWADSVNAKQKYAVEYGKASDKYSSSLASYQDENYPTSTDEARAATAILDGIADTIAKTPPPLPKVAVQAQPTQPDLPAVYVVRLIPARRDCLWRIAEYPFIYNNPLKWPVLYDANKKTFRDPGNPDLIFPGQKLQIPSIAGEARTGTFDPKLEQDYKPLPK